MTTLVLENVARRSDTARGPGPAHAARTLEALVTRAWLELDLHGGTACLACGSRMQTLKATGGAGPIGHCAACGSQLS
jgi:hypothetical protein